MGALVDDIRDMLAEARKPDWSGEILGPLVSNVGASAPSASAAEKAEGMALLVQCIREDDIQPAGFASLSGGTLVEQGADPAALADALLERAPTVLPHALRFVDRACELVEEGYQPAPGEGGPHDQVLRGRVVELPVIQAIANADPDAAKAWMRLPQYCLPLIAVASRSADVLARAKADATLVQTAFRLGPDHPHAGWLNELLRTITDPVVVLVPETRQGFEFRVDGVSDNFQLHTLIAAFLNTRLDAGDTAVISAEALATAEGTGPQIGEHIIRSAWQLFTWPAAVTWESGEVDLRYFIPHEGLPADIAPFGGWRVILMGPGEPARSWRAQRTFDKLMPTFELVEAFSPEDVDGWMERLRRAASAS